MLSDFRAFFCIVCYTIFIMKPKMMIRNAGKPKGLWGKLMISTMNVEHTELSWWGLSFLPAREYNTGLDIGCGGGMNIIRLADICLGKVHGIDVSPLSVKEATKRCKKLIKKDRVEVGLGNVSALPYPSESMDIVTAFETVYFWDKIEKCFAEVYRVLKDEGVFLITNELKAEKDDPDKYEKLESILQMNIYTEEELKSALQNAGFVDVKAEVKGKDWICVTAIKKE